MTQEGQRFEVQFHTPESFHAKQNITHASYERMRNSLTSDAERRELGNSSEKCHQPIRLPDAAPDIPDYKKEGY